MFIKIQTKYNARFCSFNFKEGEYNEDEILVAISNIIIARRKEWRVTELGEDCDDYLFVQSILNNDVFVASTLAEVYLWAATLSPKHTATIEDE